MKSNLSAMTQAKRASKAAKRAESKAAKAEKAHRAMRASQGAAQSPDMIPSLTAGTQRQKSEREVPPYGTSGYEARDHAADVFIEENALHVDGDLIDYSYAEPIMGQSTRSEKMTLTLKGLNKKGTQAIYGGAYAAIRISTSNFAGKTAPAELTDLDALVGPREKKVKLTKEQRAALPKPTAAERRAQAQKRVDAALARLRKLEAADSM